ncbi:MAG: glutamate 5-kinase [Robiginitomaculum sp.]
METIDTTISKYKRVTIKIGSVLLIDAKTGTVNQEWLTGLVQDVAQYTKQGMQIIIVSSGAIALGRERLSLQKQPLTMAQKQACAAVGQALLIQAYESTFRTKGIIAAQALLTINDTENRSRWINAKNTLEALLTLGTIPIINENDTIATDEIRYGDNDRLAARVAQMLSSDCLVLLSDIDGLYNKDPRTHADAKHIPYISKITQDIMDMGGSANYQRGTGTGGMKTKLMAAKIATSAGCSVVITKGDRTNPIAALDDSKTRSSWFETHTSPILARKQWIANSLRISGSVWIDQGAEKALQDGGSLLAAGVTKVSGNFSIGEPIAIKNHEGKALGKGLISYSLQDTMRIRGKHSGKIKEILGFSNGSALIHRDNMALFT